MERSAIRVSRAQHNSPGFRWQRHPGYLLDSKHGPVLFMIAGVTTGTFPDGVEACVTVAT